jgi:hypothetical protein
MGGGRCGRTPGVVVSLIYLAVRRVLELLFCWRAVTWGCRLTASKGWRMLKAAGLDPSGAGLS